MNKFPILKSFGSFIFIAFFMTSSFSSVVYSQNSQKKKKVISSEGKIRKAGDKTVIDFGETSISGARKAPVGSLINQRESNKGYNFIKIRKKWLPEMKNSTRNLDVLD